MSAIVQLQMPSARKVDGSAVQIHSVICNAYVHMSKATQFFRDSNGIVFRGSSVGSLIFLAVPQQRQASRCSAPVFQINAHVRFPAQTSRNKPINRRWIKFPFVCLRHCRMPSNAAVVTGATSMGIIRLNVPCRATNSLSAPWRNVWFAAMSHPQTKPFVLNPIPYTMVRSC
jgi:hypothetical protein